MQVVSNDQTVRNDTVLDIKVFNNRFLTAQAKKGVQLDL